MMEKKKKKKKGGWIYVSLCVFQKKRRAAMEGREETDHQPMPRDSTHDGGGDRKKK